MGVYCLIASCVVVEFLKNIPLYVFIHVVSYQSYIEIQLKRYEQP